MKLNKYSIVKTKKAGYALQCNTTFRIICSNLTKEAAERILKALN